MSETNVTVGLDEIMEYYASGYEADVRACAWSVNLERRTATLRLTLADKATPTPEVSDAR